MKGLGRWGGPSGLAWLLPANKQSLPNWEGPKMEQNLPSALPGFHRHPRTQSCSGERSHNWSHSATFRLASTLHVPYQTLLGAAGDVLGVQSRPTEPLGCTCGSCAPTDGLAVEKRVVDDKCTAARVAGPCPRQEHHVGVGETEGQRPVHSCRVNGRQR